MDQFRRPDHPHKALTAQGEVRIPNRLLPRVKRRAFEIAERTRKDVTPEALVSLAIETLLAQPVAVNAEAVAAARSRGLVG